MTDQPNATSNPSPPIDHPNSGQRDLSQLVTRAALWLLLLAIVVLLLIAIRPQMGDARGAANRNHCLSNIREIMQAFQAYEAEHGHFPPAFLANDQGQPMHSWRVLLLPYLLGDSLYSVPTAYDRYRFEEPWDSPHNLEVCRVCPDVFTCPSYESRPEDALVGFTNYVAITGPDCVMNGVTPTTMQEIVDGAATTAVIVDVNETAVPWSSPQDISLDEFLALFDLQRESFNHHDGLTILGLANNHALPILPDMPTETLKALSTKAGEESVDLDEL